MRDALSTPADASIWLYSQVLRDLTGKMIRSGRQLRRGPPGTGKPESENKGLAARVAAARQAGTLNLSDMKLTAIPAEVFASQTDNDSASFDKTQPKWWEAVDISVVDVSHNAISSLPPQIGTLTALSVLNASCNKIASLPVELYSLGETLKKLDLSGNCLTEIGQGIVSLQCLAELRLEKNALETLPDSIGQLKSLQVGKRRLCCEVFHALLNTYCGSGSGC